MPQMLGLLQVTEKERAIVASSVYRDLPLQYQYRCFGIITKVGPSHQGFRYVGTKNRYGPPGDMPSNELVALIHDMIPEIEVHPSYLILRPRPWAVLSLQVLDASYMRFSQKP